MFKMDLSEMDRLKDQLYRSAAEADEALYIIQKLKSEISNDDLLKQYAQYEALADDLICADSALTHIKETLFDLGQIVSETTGICREAESEKANIIRSDH